MTGRTRIPLGIVVAGMIAALTAACSPAEQGVIKAQTGEPVIVLTEGECEATCPVYAMTLRPDGSYLLHAERFVKDPGVHEGTLDAAAWTAAEEALEEASFWTQAPEQTTSTLPSCQSGPPVVSITWRTAEGRQKTVNYRVGCGDAAIRQVVGQLRAAMSFDDLDLDRRALRPDGSR
jgi:hypothetical protein